MKNITALIVLACLVGCAIAQEKIVSSSDINTIKPIKIENKLIITNPIMYAINEQVDAASVIGDKTDDSPECDKECYSIFWVDTSKGGQLSIEYFHDDLTFKEPSDNIINENIQLWDNIKEDWIPYDNQEEGMYVKLTATKKVNEDTAYRPRIDYPYASVTGDSLALWKKGAEIAQTGLVALYHLDETSGTIAADTAGYNHNGSYANSPILGTGGIFGNQMNSSYLGTEGNKSMNTSYNFGANNTGSITFWCMELPSTGGGGTRVLSSENTGDDGMYIVKSSNNLFRLYNATVMAAQLIVPYTSKAWTHYAWMWNSTNTWAFINGTTKISAVKWTGTLRNSNPIKLGSWITGTSSGTNASYDELGLWNISLSDSQVQNLYESGITQVDITTYPSNITTGVVGTYQDNQTYLIGFPDTTVASNISWTNATGSTVIMRTNAGVETNYSNVYLTKINSTHWSLLDFAKYTNQNTPYTTLLTAFGGNSLVTSASITTSFLVNVTAPKWTAFTANDSNVGTCNKIVVTYTIVAGTNALNKWWFTRNGTFVQSAAASAGANSLTWAECLTGNYSLITYVNDTSGNTNSSTNAVWVYFNTPPTLGITAPTNTTYASILNVPVTLTCSDAVAVSKKWFGVDGGATSFYTATTSVSFSGSGGHYLDAYCNNTFNNITSARVYFSVQALPPSLSGFGMTPTTLYYSQNSTGEFTLAAGEVSLDKCWLKESAETTPHVIGAATAGLNSLLYQMNGAYGTMNIKAYVNDTEGTVTSSGYITLTVIPPLNTSQTQGQNDLMGGHPLQAAEGVFTALIGNLFWGILIATIFIGLWLRTMNFTYATLVLFIINIVIGYKLPGEMNQLVWLIYVAAIFQVIFKRWSPSYTQ